MRTFDTDYINHNNHRKHARRSNNRVCRPNFKTEAILAVLIFFIEKHAEHKCVCCCLSAHLNVADHTNSGLTDTNPVRSRWPVRQRSIRSKCRSPWINQHFIHNCHIY